MIPEPLLSKLWKKTTIQAGSNCWLFSSTNQRGHGQIRYEGHVHGVHRLSAHFYHGLNLKDPTLQANHICMNRNCWNPQHIYIGTQSQNMKDAVLFGTYNNQNTIKTHCKRGHPLEGENLLTDKNGGRHCKTCKAQYDKDRRNPPPQTINSQETQ